MLDVVHLIRHGEVANPRGVVYADLPGFVLSDTGRAQAQAAADHLARAGLDAVWTSPLERAKETASYIAARCAVPTTVQDDLTEWGLGRRWAGVAWDDLPVRFPGELEAYLAHPVDLPFAPESISAVAARVVAVVAAAGRAHPGSAIALVSHQDPVQAARLHLSGRSLAQLGVDKPGHACVISLRRVGKDWEEIEAWCPPQASAPFPPPGDRP